MPGWIYDPASASYALKVENGVYHVVQAEDGTWRAFFVPHCLVRYETDQEAMRAVEDYLTHRL
jgi:hypothetical protein